MKIINFTAKYIMPKLINKEKCQTIRSAFKIVDGKLLPKHSRLKVGDKVKHIWHQRSTYNEFCAVCGTPIKTAEGLARYCDTEDCPEFGRATNTFNKILGTGTITDVFDIKMAKIENGYRVENFENNFFHFPSSYFVFKKYNYANNDFINDLAKRDGFDSTKDFLNWFHNYYNLIKEKPFWVYRWKWD